MILKTARLVLLLSLLTSSCFSAADHLPVPPQNRSNIYAIPAGIGAAFMLDSLGRYASDRADIERLTQSEEELLRRPRWQRLYDPTLGLLRESSTSLLRAPISLFLLPIAELKSRRETARYFSLSQKDRRAYAAGYSALSDAQKEPLYGLQKKLRRLALGRLVTQFAAGASVLPYCIHQMVIGRLRYSKAQIGMLGAALGTSLAALIADTILFTRLRNQYADWVKKVLVKGYDVLKKEAQAQRSAIKDAS